MPPSHAPADEESSSISQVEGIWAAAITPCRDSGHEIDLGAAFEIVDFLNSQSIDGIVLLGSTGEFVHFDFEERLRFVQMAIKRSRKPVLANASHSTFAATLAISDAALDAGAVGVLVMPPYYFRYSQPLLFEYFRKLGQDLRGSIFLYNIPDFTSAIEKETALELLESGMFAGIKDSSGCPDYFSSLAKLRNRQCVQLIVGNDEMLVRGWRQGADGVISGIAAMAPELIVALSSAARAGDESEIARLEPLLAECLAWLQRFPTPIGIKVASTYRGLNSGKPAIPSDGNEMELLRDYENWYRDWLVRIGR